MRRTVGLIGTSVAAALVLASIAPVPGARGADIPKDALYVPGEVVVIFRNRGRMTSALAQARALARKVDGRVSRLASRSRAAVLKTGRAADVRAVARRLSADPNVRFAEPNYIYRATGPAPLPYVVRRSPGAAGKVAVSKDALRAMKTRTKAGIRATYPTDTQLWDNAGWEWVGAWIVWNNTTASRNVCVVDTGVDYLHQDLGTRIVKGWDCVNEDADPMDDNGHGTHVAGIIAAKQNNAMGIAGVSPTAKVVAMKALNAEGWGTNFDIKQAIDKCASRTDVSIINLSIGGPYSKLQELAVLGAAGRGKLVVASAGNEGSEMPYCFENTDTADLTDTLYAGVRSYPAGFATASPTYTWDGSTCVATGTQLHDAYAEVLSVAAGGAGAGFDYSCMYDYSNVGDWVNITAPGTDILSTTPWDKPFTRNAAVGDDPNSALLPRYDYMSGTSMAAAFVSGAAARAWGYLAASEPNVTASFVAKYLKETGYDLAADDKCWPAVMAGVTDVNVAAALNRGALWAEAFDAVTGLSLVGATIQAIQGTSSVKATAVITAVKDTSADYPQGYLSFPSSVDLINIPADQLTTLKVNKSGYTAAATNAFVGGDGYPNGTIEGPWGYYGYAGYAAVPPRSARFSAVSAWDPYSQPPELTTQLPAGNPDGDFMVGWDVCGDRPDLENDNAGELSQFPFAQELYPYVHGYYDDPQYYGDPSHWIWIGNLWDTHQVVQRTSATALPYYQGSYVLRAYNGNLNFGSRQGSVFIWKDGALKQRVDMTGEGCDDVGTNSWWEALAVTSGSSGSVTYAPKNKCYASGSLGNALVNDSTPVPTSCSQ